MYCYFYLVLQRTFIFKVTQHTYCNTIDTLSIQYTCRPQDLIPAGVSKNVLSGHNAFRVTVDWPSYNHMKASR